MNIQPFTVSIPFHAIASGRTGCNCNCHCYLFVFYFVYYSFSSLITKPFRFYCITLKISVFIQIKKASAHKRQPYIIACWTSNLIPTFKHSRIHSFTHSNIQSFKHSSIHAFKQSHTHTFKHSNIQAITHSHIHTLTIH